MTLALSIASRMASLRDDEPEPVVSVDELRDGSYGSDSDVRARVDESEPDAIA